MTRIKGIITIDNENTEAPVTFEGDASDVLGDWFDRRLEQERQQERMNGFETYHEAYRHFVKLASTTQTMDANSLSDFMGWIQHENYPFN